MYMYNPLFFFYTEKKLVVRRNFFSFSDFFFFLTGIDTQLFVLTQKSDNFFFSASANAAKNYPKVAVKCVPFS